MIIGVDFDNTIVCYDKVFYQVAREQQLIPVHILSHKNAIRDYLRQTNQEDKWTELQGLVYGKYINYAPPFPGVLDFFQGGIDSKIIIYIISHKTRYPYLGDKCDLHQSAYLWLEKQGFYTTLGLARNNVFFDLTKEEKILRISTLKCTDFIDDLPEFLMEPTFPQSVNRILFDVNNRYENSPIYYRATSWQQISAKLLYPEYIKRK